MKPQWFSPEEVSVVSDSRPVVRTVMYVREYSSGVTEKDTMQLFGEYMIVYYYPLQTKVKGNKRGRISKRQGIEQLSAAGQSFLTRHYNAYHRCS